MKFKTEESTVKTKTTCAAVLLCVLLSMVSTVRAAHPYLFTTAQINQLALGGSDWIALKKTCDDQLNTMIGAEYAGWGWRDAIEKYALAYLVAKKNGLADSTKYAEKGLGLAKVLSRHFGGYGSTYFENYQFIGLGDGATTSFPLPMTPMPGTTVQVMHAPVTEAAVTYAGVEDVIKVGGNSVFAPILRISNTSGGPANYAATDYQMEYRDPVTNDTWVMRWLTNNHPAIGAVYYVKVPAAVNPTTSFTITNNAVTFSSAPSGSEAVFVSFMSNHYEQTGNFLGGLNASQADGPGYPNRAFGTGLAEGYDAFYGFPEFTPDLKTEFANVQNARLDWYKQFGYEHVGDIGNYYIEGFLEPVFFTGYGTQPENTRAVEWQNYTVTLAQSTVNALKNKIPGAYGFQGDYDVGTFTDILHVFSLLKYAGGPDLLTGLSWTDSLIPAMIHGTKPDRVTFYDGGDWSTLPAAAPPYGQVATEFINDMPNHPMVPFARQWLTDMGQTPPAGLSSDYKTSFVPSFLARLSGPLYARTDWGTQAVWVSLVASPILGDHQHQDQGHFTIQRGADYLIQNGGGYGVGTTLPWHNTIGFDDRGAGNLITYPPGQGYWGDSVSIGKFIDNGDWVYGQTNFADAYRQAGGTINTNSVKKAVRSLVLLRSSNLIILHDQVRTAAASIKQIFNMNFAGTPTQNGTLFTMAKGASKLFVRQMVVPSGAVTALVSDTSENQVISKNYTVTASGLTDDTYLHVFQAVASTATAMTPVGSVAASVGAAQGIEVADGSTQRVLLFATQEYPYISGNVTYASSSAGTHKDVIADLRPNGSYTVTATASVGGGLFSGALAASSQGTLIVGYTSTGPATVALVANGFAVKLGDSKSPMMNFLISSRSKFHGVTISYAIPEGISRDSRLSLSIFALDGRLVAVLANGTAQPGQHTAQWNANGTVAGTYLIKLRCGKNSTTQKIVLQK